MHFPRAVAALAAAISFADAQSIRGFNSGNLLAGGAPKAQSDFQAEFTNQKNIAGSNGQFNSARLYTMIQGGTTNTPISAIPAAIATKTGLLLGLWASAGQDDFNNELAALKSAISQYGTAFTSLVQGISVGSEDLYRDTPIGIANTAGVGAGPDVIANFIGQVKSLISGTALSGAMVGHVDTWNAWTNSSNTAAIQASDFLGIDEYPYYQSTDNNPIANAGSLFYAALDATQAVSGGKPVWITEAGWPTTGATVGQAVASVENARSFWLQVYCTLPASTPVYWYEQYDNTDSADFGVVGASLSTTPLYDLSCAQAKAVSSSMPASSATSSASSSTVASSSGSAAMSSASSSATATSASAAFPSMGSSSATVAPVLISSSATSVSSMGAVSVSSVGSAKSSTSAPTVVGITPIISSSSSAMSTASVYYPIANATLATSATAGSGTLAPISPKSTLTPAGNSASNMQVYTLALLIVPAALALLA